MDTHPLRPALAPAPSEARDARWVPRDAAFVRRRYDRLAPIYRVFEWVLLLPPGIRRRAVDALGVRPGDRVLEVGCGTGRNLRWLREAVGEPGVVEGLDLSDEMLERARRTSAAWENVRLVRTDALAYDGAGPFDGILFSLSYAVMPRGIDVLRRMWDRLAPGGRLVIMDAQLAPGILGKALRFVEPAVVWFLERTVLGNPYACPIDDLRSVAGSVDVEEWALRTYFIATARKPVAGAAETGATSDR